MKCIIVFAGPFVRILMQKKERSIPPVVAGHQLVNCPRRREGLSRLRIQKLSTVRFDRRFRRDPPLPVDLDWL